MKNLIVSGLTVDDLLLQIEQIVETKINSQFAIQKSNEPDFVTRKEAAAFLKITLPTLHDWTKLGWLQSYKIGKRVLYKKAELEKSLHQVLSNKYKRGLL